MSFLKKHWRFTVPTVIVVCVMLLGVVVLYSTSQTPEEPARVYAMPERPIAVAPEITAAHPVYQSETVQPTTDLPETAPTNTDNLVAQEAPLSEASCCPEESPHFDEETENMLLGLTEEDIAGYEADERWATYDSEIERRYQESLVIEAKQRELQREEAALVDWETFDYSKTFEFFQTEAGKRVMEITDEQVTLSNQLIELGEWPEEPSGHTH